MNMDKMKQLAKVALESGRENAEIVEMKRIPGGSINEAFYVATNEAQFFMKFHAEAPPQFFKSEATGLRIIKETETISVPNYISYSDQRGKSFLLLEWVEGEKTDRTEEVLGYKLAQFHAKTKTKHGLPTDTYIGYLPQPNDLVVSWLEYYREFRLGNQLKIGVEKETITGERRKRMEKLLERLDEWVPNIVEASPLHGDLYSGNWIIGPGGEPYLVDPSILYGDRHFEIAFTEMFGGFPARFYESYNEHYPLRDDYEEVKGVYQLFYLLAHLNMFGESYGQSVDRILTHYVG